MRKKRYGKQTILRTRRSPYERSLEYATNRLKIALEEQADYQQRLSALDKEIPYLQTVIRALKPVTEANVINENVKTPFEDRMKKMGIPTGTLDGGKFIAPALSIPNPPDEISQEDFLADRVPGQELLP